MQIILNIPDNKSFSILEVLKSISFVKIEAVSHSKAIFLKELQASADEVNLAKQGKLKLKSAEELLDEL
jgi:hypothetical protein